MGGRWIEEEVKAIEEVRRRLKDEIARAPPFPEVIGDRRILRFLRGKQLNIDEATSMFKDFLKWRSESNVDFIRQDIIYGGKNSPFKFPFGKKIIDLAPQIIITRHAMDKKGQPLALEQYDFSPKEVFKAVSKDDYLTFLTYALEYRAIVMEQLSHEKEMEYLKSHPNPEDREDGYGVILLDFTIRDLKGIGLAHLGADGRAIVKAALSLGLSNYPEYLGKSHMINVPWVFNSMWYFVKGMLDEFTLAKINLCGSDYMDALLEDVPFESIPECLGGGFKLYNEAFDFDITKSGPFFYEGVDQDLKRLGMDPTQNASKALNNQAEAPLSASVPTVATGIKESIQTSSKTGLNNNKAVNAKPNTTPSVQTSTSFSGFVAHCKNFYFVEILQCTLLIGLLFSIAPWFAVLSIFLVSFICYV